MLHAVVVYESMYGNTRAIAEAIASGLGGHAEVHVRRVTDADASELEWAQLVVVGGPTHMHGLSTSMSRRSAVDAAEEDRHGSVEPHAADGHGLRSWLAGLTGDDRVAAAFDTRIERSELLTGSAARGIARRLRHRGYTLIGEPESFFVDHNEGPLGEGETERACAWGEALLSFVPRAIA